MEHKINQSMLELFRQRLIEGEKSNVTLEKYMRDVKAFWKFSETYGYVNKEVVSAYKEKLTSDYMFSSVNSMLAAVNCFLKEMGRNECIVKALEVQKEAFRSPEKDLSKEEYHRLLYAAQKKGNERLYLLMQTLCSTGIRIGELRCITVEAIYTGRARVRSKGKSRTVLIPVQLCGKLKHYIKKKQINSGSVFVTRNGKPVDRSNICHEMKALCELADVPKEKIFPHNLRHLFACTYYALKKDLTHLADLLGHSNINTTRIYTLVSEEEQVKQIEVLGLVV